MVNPHILTLKEWAKLKTFFMHRFHYRNCYQCGCGFTLTFYIKTHLQVLAIIFLCFHRSAGPRLLQIDACTCSSLVIAWKSMGVWFCHGLRYRCTKLQVLVIIFPYLQAVQGPCSSFQQSNAGTCTSPIIARNQCGCGFTTAYTYDLGIILVRSQVGGCLTTKNPV